MERLQAISPSQWDSLTKLLMKATTGATESQHLVSYYEASQKPTMNLSFSSLNKKLIISDDCYRDICRSVGKI